MALPLALYTDWKNVYVREATEKELLRGEVPVTQFGRMCERLGIHIIAANSPQAKGRVERNHGTHQDRLVKKLRRKKIQSYEAANEYLEAAYLAEHNQRFARVAAAKEDYHRRRPSQTELDEAFRLETGRTLGNDWVVRHGNRYFQVKRRSRYAPTKSQVVICEWEDGKLEIRYGGRRLCHAEIAAQPAIPPPAARPRRPRRMPAPPPASHPWRKDIERCGHEAGQGNEESCGNGGVVESVEIQERDFPSSHRLLLGQINKPKQQTASARKKGTLLSRYRIINATLRKLAQLGVSKRTLFPDLAGVAEFVRWKHLHEVNGNSLRPSNERPPNSNPNAANETAVPNSTAPLTRVIRRSC
jgi:hypothetical protein